MLGDEPPPVETAAARWRRRIETARADSEHLVGYLEIRYEDLVADTETALRKVCEYLELDYDPVMLRYHETAAERLAEMARAMPARAGRARARFWKYVRAKCPSSSSTARSSAVWSMKR